jgi:hypothetical protein
MSTPKGDTEKVTEAKQLVSSAEALKGKKQTGIGTNDLSLSELY